MKTVRGYHFLACDGKTACHCDKSSEACACRTLITVGQTLRVEGPPIPCKRGLHASRRALDALRYAPGQIVCLVDVGGEIAEESDKLCGTARTVVAMADATQTLHEFALWVAEQALLRERAAGREPDARSWAALEVKARWLRGEASNEELAAAWAAARAAAAAARAAAAAAAAAAWAAAWDAAWDAARAAAAAAWEDQNAELERRLLALLGVSVEVGMA